MFQSHPSGLSTLFFTEMWERFSYYGMRALLLLFMVEGTENGGMGMSTQSGAAIYGLYTASVYLMALPGGWIADRLIGQQKAVFVGGCIIAAGHFSMAIPLQSSFFTGLVLIVVGTGLLKPNVSAMVGQLYPEGGARRDAAFSVFYMGINLGAFLGPLVCGYLGESINWHLGFGAAGIGMVCGLIQYRYRTPQLEGVGVKTFAATQHRRDLLRFYSVLVTLAVGIILIALLNHLALISLSLTSIAGASGIIILIAVCLYFIAVFSVGNLNKQEKRHLRVIALLFLAYAIFSAGFEQAGSSMNLFAKQLTDRSIMGWEMPASWLQSTNAMFIILMAPVMGSLWLWLRERNPSILIKFSFGLLLLGSGFYVMAWGASFADAGGPGVSPMWLISAYYLHTIGELCLSPVGLSAVTKLSPKALVGQMMGIWFMGAALGNLIAGLAAGQVEQISMAQLFFSIATITTISGVAYLVVAKPISQKWMPSIR